MIHVNGFALPYKENQTVEQLVARLKEEPDFYEVFEFSECIIVRNGEVIPPYRRHEVMVEENDTFSVFPIISGG